MADGGTDSRTARISGEEALAMHASGRPGKLATLITKPLTTARDLSLAYSPGVAEPCLHIQRNPDLAYEYTTKGNMVAVVSNGTAVLGLGNLGALASKPVMEGKIALFKRFADVDGIDLEISTENVDEFVNCVRFLGPGFGGITRNLEIFKPIVAAVNGFAISGGFELALACDLRFCSPNAEFALQDAQWGFHACDGGLIRLPQIVGLGHAMEIVLSGERVNAEHAYRIGLVNRIWPAGELLSRTLGYAQMLAKRSPLSHRFAKEVMKRAVGLSQDEALRLESRSFHDVGLTDDLAEGTTAFRERREADFKGR